MTREALGVVRLPRGSSMPDAEWAPRHRALQWLVLVHVPGLLLFSLVTGGASPAELAWSVLLPLAGAGLAAVPGQRRAVRAAITSCTLMGCSVVAVHLADGTLDTHFHLFAMIPVIAFYEEWLPFGVAVAFVVADQALAGGLRAGPFRAPEGEDGAARVAVMHSAFLAVTCAVGLANWRLHELSRARQLTLTGALTHRARHDRLTGLPNREWLAEEVAAETVLGEARDGGPLAVLIFDVDRLAEVNDTLGHDVADGLLVEVAARLRSAVPAGEPAVRLTGDEFAVVLVGDRARRAAGIADEIRRRITTDRVGLAGVDLDVEVSVGVAADAEAGADGPGAGAELRDRLAHLLRCAHVALNAGQRDRTVLSLYDPDEDRHTIERLALLTDLREALFSDQLDLAYQPKVSLVDGSVVGVEALLRWTHPVRGPVPPLEFVPAAEATNLVTPLTYRVLGLALVQAARWVAAGVPMSVSVNVPPRCLVEDGFVDTVAAALASTGVPPHLLCLELTETSLMADPDRTLAVIHELRGHGIELSLDDFGTGFSSMNYLRRLPVAELKIDKAFVGGLLVHAQDAILVETTIDLAHRLGMLVVAEGVEDEATAVALAGLGCDAAQGYHFTRPLAAVDLLPWVLGRRQGSGVLPG